MRIILTALAILAGLWALDHQPAPATAAQKPAPYEAYVLRAFKPAGPPACVKLKDV